VPPGVPDDGARAAPAVRGVRGRSRGARRGGRHVRPAAGGPEGPPRPPRERPRPRRRRRAVSLHPGAAAAYGGRLRVRVGALVFDDAADPRALLLVEHAGLWDARPFWTPPGGG